MLAVRVLLIFLSFSIHCNYTCLLRGWASSQADTTNEKQTKKGQENQSTKRQHLLPSDARSFVSHRNVRTVMLDELSCLYIVCLYLFDFLSIIVRTMLNPASLFPHLIRILPNATGEV